MHFLCKLHRQGQDSNPSTRHSLGTTTLPVRADPSQVDEYSGFTVDLKRQHLVTRTWGAEQLNRLNQTAIIAVFHHHSKIQHNVPVSLASAPHPAFMVTDQTSEGPCPLCTANPIQECAGHTTHTSSTYLWEEEECWLLAGAL